MSRIPAEISLFTIFNSKMAENGKEEEKILFYYPTQASTDDKLGNVGLCEAIIQLSLDITTKDPVKVLKTDKAIKCFSEPEEGYWIVIELLTKQPEEEAQKGDARDIASQPYSGEDVGALLDHIYRIYRLFHGKLSDTLSNSNDKYKNNRPAVLENLEKFVGNYLSALDLSNLGIFTKLDGLQYLPIERGLFLEIQELMNSTSHRYKEIKYSLLLYADKVVWSDLQKDTVRLIYKYLKSSFTVKSTVSKEDEEENPFMFPPDFKGGFLTNTGGDYRGKNVRRIEVYIEEGKKGTMSIFQRGKFSSIYFLDYSNESRDNLFESLYDQMNENLTILNAKVSKALSGSASEEKLKFIYFNHRNLALKTSLKSISQNQLSSVLDVIKSMSKEFSRPDAETDDIVTKMHTNSWVVGKRTEGRELYVIFDHKDARIQEVEDEVNRLSANLLKDIFFS